MNTNKKYYSILLIFLISIMTVHASYDTYHADSALTSFVNGHPITNYEAETIGTGTFTEPLIDNLDTVNGNEIYNVGTDGILRIIGGRDRTTIDTINIGTPVINPVICNIGNDIHNDYVGIFNNGTNNNLVALTLNSANSKISVESVASVPPVNNDTSHPGNMVCGQLFLGNGDQKYYVAWINQTKVLQLAILASTTDTWSSHFDNSFYREISTTAESFSKKWYIAIKDSDVSANEVSKDTAGYGKQELVLDTAFDPTPNYVTLSWFAGTKYITYSPSRQGIFNTGIYDVDVQTVFDHMGTTLTTNETSTINLYGGIRRTSGSASSQMITRTSINAPPFIVLGMHTGLFGTADLTVDGNFTLSSSGGPGNKRQTATSIIRYDNLPSKAVIISIGINGGVKTGLHIINMATLTPSLDIPDAESNFPVVLFGTKSEVSTEISSPFRIYTGQFDNSGDADILFMGGGGGTTEHPLYVFYASTNYTPVNVFNITAPINSVDTPIPDLLTSDGDTDFLYSNPGIAQVIVTQLVSGGTATNLPFSVRFTNSSFEPITNTKIITDTIITNYSGNTINYAVTCNIASTVIFSDSFTPSLITFPTSYDNYTLATDNIIGMNLSSYLTSQGLRFSINGENSTYFDLLRETNNDRRADLTVSMHLKNNGNGIYDIPISTLDGLLTDYIRVNKTGTNVTLYRVNNGIPVMIGSALTTTLSPLGSFPSDEIFLQLDYAPAVNKVTGQNYFTSSIRMNYNTVVGSSGDTSVFGGSAISNIEVFTETISNFTIKSMSLISDPSNSRPVFTSFFKTDPPNFVDQDTYTVMAGANGGNSFTSTCSYSQSGTYTQRHYIGANTSDYSNYATVVIVVSDFANANNQEALISGNTSITPSNGGDAFTNGLEGLLSAIGIISVGGRFFFWTIIMLIVGAVLFMVNVYLGIVGIIGMILLGVVLSMLPLWVVIIMVIICAAIFVTAFNFLRGT